MSERDQELARAWFDKAENDLLTVRNNLAAEVVPADMVCFHCQQAAEKYLKGFLAWHAVPFHRTHDLVDLVTHCSSILPALSAIASEATILADYAVDVRYPDAPHSNPTLEQAREAMSAALAVRRAVLTALGLEDERTV
jgi:HEPN domain-containing protein